jgi:osomolarity two-component system response regulator SSK1
LFLYRDVTAAEHFPRLHAGRHRLVTGMSSIKTRLHKFLRRSSVTSTATRSLASSAGSERQPQPPPTSSLAESAAESPRPTYTRPYSHTSSSTHAVEPTACPEISLEAPTPIDPSLQPAALLPERSPSSPSSSSPLPARSSDTSPAASPALVRRQSVVAATDASVLGPLLVPEIPSAALTLPAFTTAMLHRKIWVKRPHASATLVQIREDDLVDDVREMILKKYANSLGRSFDSPDVTLRIVPRDTQRGGDRTLGPEEEMCRTLDAYFPGGQTVTEALIIDVPQRRTPKPSPRVPFYYAHHEDGVHQQTEYFPPMPVIAPSPQAVGSGQHEARIPLPHAPHSIAVLNTGQLPALPSPGGTRRGPLHTHRPKYPRTHTASPTTLGGGIPSSAATARPLNRPRHDSSASEAKNSATSNNAIPTPPASTDLAVHPQALQTSSPPTPRIASPQPNKGKKRRKAPVEAPSLPAGLLDGSVPPINVLIVEDNIINLRVLGAFMQRLKVRWQRAMNGKEAVTKWKAGGFHLVLMDIQLPVMNGLEATKEIRRLERVNNIGVFSSGSSEAPNTRLGQDSKGQDELMEDDRLGDKGMFKSPVIIVALTASSLQSDRHEALAAGCNDFLTKVRSDPLLLRGPVLTFAVACQLCLARTQS